MISDRVETSSAARRLTLDTHGQKARSRCYRYQISPSAADAEPNFLLQEGLQPCRCVGSSTATMMTELMCHVGGRVVTADRPTRHEIASRRVKVIVPFLSAPHFTVPPSLPRFARRVPQGALALDRITRVAAEDLNQVRAFAAPGEIEADGDISAVLCENGRSFDGSAAKCLDGRRRRAIAGFRGTRVGRRIGRPAATRGCRCRNRLESLPVETTVGSFAPLVDDASAERKCRYEDRDGNRETAKNLIFHLGRRRKDCTSAPWKLIMMLTVPFGERQGQLVDPLRVLLVRKNPTPVEILDCPQGAADHVTL